MTRTRAALLAASALIAEPLRCDGTFAAQLQILAPLTAPVPDEPSSNNVVLGQGVRPLLDDLLKHSPFFEAQWRRVLGARQLALQISFAHPEDVAGGLAATHLSMDAQGLRRAHVRLAAAGRRNAEVLAHELEHVLEFLDGASVPSRARQGDRSVSWGHDTGETARAVHAGRQAAHEYARNTLRAAR